MEAGSEGRVGLGGSREVRGALVLVRGGGRCIVPTCDAVRPVGQGQVGALCARTWVASCSAAMRCSRSAARCVLASTSMRAWEGERGQVGVAEWSGYCYNRACALTAC